MKRIIYVLWLFLAAFSATALTRQTPISGACNNILAEVTNNTVSWNPSRPTGYGAVPGYRPAPFGSGADLAQSSALRGREVDITGYYHWGMRDYDPVNGQWLSYDPAWNPGDPNGLSYCGGDGINYADPDGRLGKNWVGQAQSFQSSDNVLTRLKALPYGVAGTVLYAPFKIGQGFDDGIVKMAEAKQTISSYTGWRAALARTAWFPNEFGFGLAKTVYTPIQTIARTPKGVHDLFSKVGSDAYTVSVNPSVNSMFDLGEDAFGVWGVAGGSVGFYRGTGSLLGQGSSPRVFWSGGTQARNAAEAYAKATGGQTLEMTGTGRVLDSITTKFTYPILRPFWNKASFDFAASARGPVNVFQSSSRGVRIQSVWAQVEYPQLVEQGNQIIYNPAP